MAARWDGPRSGLARWQGRGLLVESADDGTFDAASVDLVCASLSCAARVGGVRPSPQRGRCIVFGVRAGALAGRVCSVLPAPRGESRSPVAGWRAVLSRRLS